MITVKFDDAEIKKALARLQHTTAHPKAALQDIGEYLLVSTKQRFSAGRAPSGAYWEENRPSTLNRPWNRGGHEKIAVASAVAARPGEAQRPDAWIA